MDKTLQELAYNEDDLYFKVHSLVHKSRSKESDEQLSNIFIRYKKVHKAYADLSSHNIEALKRGLFIQWYAQTEPPYLMGISELDEKATEEIIQQLYKFIANHKIDDEFVWMLNYYFGWKDVFEAYQSFKGFDTKVVNEQNNQLPDKIDKEKMKMRGQMGRYWNSLTRFKNL